ncbi:MAG: acylphosphatase, partial [Alphaproteobacteria bacterium]|nr:acylphosphatase [Alphaproteobacteria bacterium]
MTERIAVRVVISGRVQGVWYRGWTVERARAAGLCGWVRNRKDGSVEAVFAGSPDAVEAMIAECRKGPPAARVDAIAREDATDEGWTG